MFFSRKRKVELPESLKIGSLPGILGAHCSVILEIGSNNGDQAIELSLAFPNAKIFAFEPDPRAQTRFIENTENYKSIELIKTAISSENGTIEFHMSDGVPDNSWSEMLPEGWDLSGSIRKPKKHLEKHPWCVFERSIEVPTQSLDSFFEQQEFDSIDFIWADVQGAEIDLINGGQNALSKTRFLYTEYNNEELYEGQIPLDKILELLPKFRVHTLFKNDVLLQNTEI